MNFHLFWYYRSFVWCGLQIPSLSH